MMRCEPRFKAFHRDGWPGAIPAKTLEPLQVSGGNGTVRMQTERRKVSSEVSRLAEYRIPMSVAGELHPWVRAKFLELWRLAQTPDPF